MLKTNIKDEYDFNEYYLINKQWIEDFKNKCLYKNISKKLDEMNLNLSYKGYVLNSENIIENNNLANLNINLIEKNDNLFNENNFYLNNTYQDNFKKFDELINNNCPKDFIIVPEDLFDLFYKDINKSDEHSKNDYKYNILIGNNVFIIQDKKINTDFYIFSKYYSNFELYYIFKYNDNLTLYNEIKEFIINNNFYNYLINTI